ncbi:unnamed protein product [Gadus morhua 'NCC']
MCKRLFGALEDSNAKRRKIRQITTKSYKVLSSEETCRRGSVLTARRWGGLALMGGRLSLPPPPHASQGVTGPPSQGAPPHPPPPPTGSEPKTQTVNNCCRVGGGGSDGGRG